MLTEYYFNIHPSICQVSFLKFFVFFSKSPPSFCEGGLGKVTFRLLFLFFAELGEKSEGHRPQNTAHDDHQEIAHASCRKMAVKNGIQRGA